MATVPVPTGRAKFQDDGLSLRVAIPSRRNIVVILFLAAWLGGWYFGETSALRQILSPDSTTPRAFLGFWLAGWTIGGLCAAFLLLWMLLGREVLELRPDAIVHRRTLLGLGLGRAYDVTHVKDLRLGPAGLRSGGMSFSRMFVRKPSQMTNYAQIGDFWGITGGQVVFDYGSRTVRCGAALDEAEAKLVIERFRQRNARLRVESAA